MMRRRQLPILIVAVWLLWPALLQAHGDGAVWLLVDSGTQQLQVMRGDHVEQRFKGISVGRGGVHPKQRQGDDVTPQGRYRVRWIKPDSRFRTFVGIDYPGYDDATRGLQAGIIDAATYDRIVSALDAGEVPPQNTALGGFVGIHGLGAGDSKIHAAYNWTRGCIALTNDQIDQLMRWALPGTDVLIR